MRRNFPGLAALSGPVPAVAGIGLRFPHHTAVLAGEARAAWLEVHPENYLQGAAREILGAVRRDHPLSLHATGLSLGSADGVDATHLAAIAALAQQVAPALISDHLSWSGADGIYLPDLLPVPYTREAQDIFVRNIDQVQSTLKRTILVENPSVYFAYAESEMDEAEFLAGICRRSGCGVLLDVNNIAVSAANLGASAQDALDAMLDAIPSSAIGEVHLAGHAVRSLEGGREVHVDDHGAPVGDAVWALYAWLVQRIGPRPTLIEWDTAIPGFSVLAAEATKADTIMTSGARHAVAG